MLRRTLQQRSVWIIAIIPFFLFSLLPGQRILASQLLINFRHKHNEYTQYFFPHLFFLEYQHSK